MMTTYRAAVTEAFAGTSNTHTVAPWSGGFRISGTSIVYALD